MLVFAAEFPASGSATLDDLLACCRTWIVGSPHFPFRNALELTFSKDAVVVHEKGAHRASLGRASLSEDSELGGVQYVQVEKGKIRWTTEIVGRKDQLGLWVSVQLFCELLSPGLTMPVPQKPHFFKTLFQKLGGGSDGEFIVSDRPYLLDDSMVDRAAKIVEGTTGCALPVAYVSSNFLNHSEIDAKKIAKWMSALCHVVVEPDRGFSKKLAERTKSRNVYGGVIGIYWPASQGRHTRLFPSDFAGEEALELEVQNLVRFALASVRSTRSLTWSELRESLASRRIAELKASGDASLDEYTEAFDNEIASLKSSREDLRREVGWLRETIKKHQESGAGIIRLGREQELYAGEIGDVIISILESVRAQSTEPTFRRQTIVADLLAVNEATGRAAEIEASIKSILSQTDRIGATELEGLRKLGFAIEDGGKHYKALFAGDPRLSFTLFKTASDKRAGKNLSSDIVRKLFK